MNRWLESAFSTPLFWKILVANAVVVVLAALLGGIVQIGPAALAWLAVAGVSLSLLVNAALLRLALDPLETLQRVATKVRSGELDVRASASPLADRATRRLTETFNGALDALAASRRRVRSLLARSMQAEEADRRRVAAALEDESAQRLAGLLVRLRLLARDPDPEVLESLVEEALREVAGAAEVVRGYAAGRRPAILMELGLAVALQAEARRLRVEKDVAVHVAGDAPRTLTPDVELVLYRVLAQALDGAVRHGGARSVHLRLSNGEGRMVASVVDDGRRTERWTDARRGEIEDMRERMESVGGCLAMCRATKRGTRLEMEVPA